MKTNFGLLVKFEKFENYSVAVLLDSFFTVL